jgi:hypothetical protein
VNKIDLAFIMRDCGGDVEKAQRRIDRAMGQAIRPLRAALVTAEEYVLWCMGKRETTEAVQPERILAVITGALSESVQSAGDDQ